MTSTDDEPTPRPLHPALLPADQLLRECELVQTRRSGPGGQHRNKVATAIVLRHLPSGISGEASERRSQADNRQVALRRLREALALKLRSDALSEARGADRHERELRARYHASHFRLGPSNEERPAVLALLLDDLDRSGGLPREVAETWGTSTSQIVRFLKSHPDAFAWLNRLRAKRGMRPLK